MPIKKVVFFLEQPFTRRNYERFGIEILSENGFTVSIFDFTPLLHPAAAAHAADAVYRDFKNLIPISSRSEAERAIGRLDPADTFVINLLGFNPENFFIYRKFTRTNLRYAVHVSGAMPDPHDRQPAAVKRAGSFLRSLRHSPSKIGYLKSLAGSIPFRLFRNRVRGATWWLAGGSESPKRYALPRDANTRVLFIHTLDYDVYLRAKAAPGEISDTAVFLDQYLPYHPDQLYFLVEYPVTPERYYPNLRRFFESLRLRSGLTTVIAGHPKSEYEKHPECFPGFEVYRDRTAEMVKTSRLVIAHGSTAINLAVLFRKPILFVTTDELERSAIRDHIHALAGWLGKKVINVDGPLEEIDLNAEQVVDEEAYRRYQNCYIVRDGTPELPFWQIVADELGAF